LIWFVERKSDKTNNSLILDNKLSDLPQRQVRREKSRRKKEPDRQWKSGSRRIPIPALSGAASPV
jgi:hypothetical protein